MGGRSFTDETDTFGGWAEPGHNRPTLCVRLPAGLQDFENIEEDLFPVLSGIEHCLQNAGLPTFLQDFVQVAFRGPHDSPVVGQLGFIEKGARGLGREKERQGPVTLGQRPNGKIHLIAFDAVGDKRFDLVLGAHVSSLEMAVVAGYSRFASNSSNRR